MASHVSGMTIETTTEAHECLEDVKDCTKNPGHKHFYNLEDLTVDNLPEGCKTEQWLSYIYKWSKRVVRLTVKRPGANTLYGTGCIGAGTEGYLIAVTNEHVISSEEDVHNCKLEFFYDTKDKTEIVASFGVQLLSCIEFLDVCVFAFFPVPPIITELMSEIIVAPNTDIRGNVITISHPHGGPKTITVGQELSSEKDGHMLKLVHTARTCPGSSGGLVILTGQIENAFLYKGGNILYTHYAGDRSFEYKGTYSSTFNVNYSVFNPWYEITEDFLNWIKQINKIK